MDSIKPHPTTAVQSSVHWRGAQIPLGILLVPPITSIVSRKSDQIAQRIERFRGGGMPAHYLGYFDCFNRQLFYEAHDVLEELWLGDRRGPDGDFYKGLIQLAGAFVHVQKNRPRPATALLRLARANLDKYPAVHHDLDTASVLALIQEWHQRLQGMPSTTGLFEKVKPPTILLRGQA